MRQHDWSSITVALKNFRSQVINPGVVDAVSDGIKMIYVEAQVYVPIANGTLADSMIETMTKITPQEIRGKVSMWGANGQLPYAWMREEGGTIRPKPTNPTGRLWWTNDQGELICARQVTQQGSHYMHRAVQEKGSEARAIILSAATGKFNLFD